MFASSRAIQCYQCGTPDSINCQDFKPLSSNMRTCESSCVSTRGEFEGLVVTSRECGGGIKDNIRYDRCTKRELGGAAHVTVCHCETDGCNLAEILREREPWSWWNLFSVLDTKV